MKKIKSKDKPKTFVTKMKKAISKGPLANIVKFEDKEEYLIVEFSKMGTSIIHYRLTENEDGFIAIFEKESIAFTHGAFKGEVQKELKRIMERFGAEVS